MNQMPHVPAFARACAASLVAIGLLSACSTEPQTVPEAGPAPSTVPVETITPKAQTPATATVTPAAPAPTAALTPTPAPASPASAAPVASGSVAPASPLPAAAITGASTTSAAPPSVAHTGLATALHKSAPMTLVKGFYINVGLFAVSSNAHSAYQKLETAGLPVFTDAVKSAKGTLTRVRVGPYTTRAKADVAATKVRSLLLEAVVFKH